MNNKRDSIIDDCKKYLGFPPYDSSTNIVLYDGYYLNSLYSKYGANEVSNTLNELRDGVGYGY